MYRKEDVETGCRKEDVSERRGIGKKRLFLESNTWGTRGRREAGDLELIPLSSSSLSCRRNSNLINPLLSDSASSFG
jgi:hypothetical protein